MSEKFAILYEYTDNSLLTKKEIQQISDNKNVLIELPNNKRKFLESKFFTKSKEDEFSLVDSMGNCVDYSIVKIVNRLDLLKALQKYLLNCSNDELEYLYFQYSNQRVKIDEN